MSQSWLLSVFSLLKSSFHFKPTLPNKDECFKEQILSVLSHHPAYGHRRIALALGKEAGRRRVRRVMKLYGIKPYKRKRAWRKRRDLRRAPAPYLNLTKGSCPIIPTLIWASDFTYLRYRGKTYYLCTYMDLYTREIVGWQISHRHTKELILETFMDAVKDQGRIPRMVHSDQGSEYCSREYTSLMDFLGIQVSMSKKASPWENGFQESFYNNFKTELGLEIDRYSSTGHLIEAIHQTINYYNQQRIHTALKMSPCQFRQLHQSHNQCTNRSTKRGT